jgi:hypothetical protein
MPNILWKKPDEQLAVTSILDGSEPQFYAYVLKDRGDIPQDWEAVAYDVETFPSEPQEAWRWDGVAIVLNADVLWHLKYALPITAFQIRAALNQLKYREQVEQAVAAGSQDLKDAWNHSVNFYRFNPQVLEMQATLGLSDGAVDAIFDLGKTF